MVLDLSEQGQNISTGLSHNVTVWSSASAEARCLVEVLVVTGLRDCTFDNLAHSMSCTIRWIWLQSRNTASLLLMSLSMATVTFVCPAMFMCLAYVITSVSFLLWAFSNFCLPRYVHVPGICKYLCQFLTLGLLTSDEPHWFLLMSPDLDELNHLFVLNIAT